MADAWQCKYLGQVIREDLRTVRLGAYIESALGDTNEDGGRAGFDVELLRMVSKVNGWRVVEIPMDYKTAQQMLAEGSVDVVMSMFRTREREKVYDFSQMDVGPLYYAFVTRMESPMEPNIPSTWNGVRVGVLAGSLAVKSLRTFLKARGVRWQAVEYEDPAGVGAPSVVDQ